MHFDMKNYLKNTRNHTVKYTLSETLKNIQALKYKY